MLELLQMMYLDGWNGQHWVTFLFMVLANVAAAGILVVGIAEILDRCRRARRYRAIARRWAARS